MSRATRYNNATSGGALTWLVSPGLDVAGRTVLLVDDVLDMGHTLSAVVARLQESNAKHIVTAVLVDKDVVRSTPVRVDEAALRCPNRYLFGHGMDYRGHWRNLAGIYALPVDWRVP